MNDEKSDLQLHFSEPRQCSLSVFESTSTRSSSSRRKYRVDMGVGVEIRNVGGTRYLHTCNYTDCSMSHRCSEPECDAQLPRPPKNNHVTIQVLD
eukprot:2580646-Amphidinium_carterae.2